MSKSEYRTQVRLRKDFFCENIELKTLKTNKIYHHFPDHKTDQGFKAHYKFPIFAAFHCLQESFFLLVLEDFRPQFSDSGYIRNLIFFSEFRAVGFYEFF
jgi:hypothetical protein